MLLAEGELASNTPTNEITMPRYSHCHLQYVSVGVWVKRGLTVLHDRVYQHNPIFPSNRHTDMPIAQEGLIALYKYCTFPKVMDAQL